MRSAATLLVLSLLVFPASAAAQIFDRCDHERAIAHRVAMPAGTALRVAAGAGTLVVRGVEGLGEARISGTACATRAALLDEVSVAVTREGAALVIETRFPDRNLRNDWARIDLVVEVPAGVTARISDGSGAAEIRGVGDLTVTDGSGDLTIEDIRGSATITDGSGSIRIRGVAGDVRIEDGSGEISLRDARASVRISDGSGSIDVRGVRGDFIVSRDGSGGVDWANVDGRVSVPNRRRVP